MSGGSIGGLVQTEAERERERERGREGERDLVDKEREGGRVKSEVVHYITKSRWDKLTQETRLSRAARRPGDRAPPLKFTERKVSQKTSKQTHKRTWEWMP